MTVHTSDGRFEGRTLVAADGSNGRTAQLAGIRTSSEHQIALEGNIHFPKGVPAEWEDVIGLHLGWLKGGYGWIFPKGDHLNIGVCSWKYNGPNLRESLGGLAQFYGYGPWISNISRDIISHCDSLTLRWNTDAYFSLETQQG